ncbi:EVE domain-containing protein [Amaricoccus sp.]|uniref:EVE domain-containing protein n=1 Tax=Amaricoccus sp. TaxID=1872485 RepID=UPI001B520C8E|nr:EVE domain-containing protein [Amaricoccus sp.]MBP7000016.1 EVE domain-containing protein [Amaricoccus sp.]
MAAPADGRGGWIAVASADHVAAGAREGLFHCSHGDGRAAARPRRGDRFAYYAPRERLDPAAPAVQAFVALGEILDDAPQPRLMAPGVEGMVRRARYEPVGRAPVRPMLPDLGFVKDPRHWGMAFRRGLFSVDAADFARIEAALRG